MASHHAPRHCFTHLDYDASTQTLTMWFTEGEVYEYYFFTAADWSVLNGGPTTGKAFNRSERRTNSSGVTYRKL
jgi:KTSC domain